MIINSIIQVNIGYIPGYNCSKDRKTHHPLCRCCLLYTSYEGGDIEIVLDCDDEYRKIVARAGELERQHDVHAHLHLPDHKYVLITCISTADCSHYKHKAVSYTHRLMHTVNRKAEPLTFIIGAMDTIHLSVMME